MTVPKEIWMQMIDSEKMSKDDLERLNGVELIQKEVEGEKVLVIESGRQMTVAMMGVLTDLIRNGQKNITDAFLAFYKGRMYGGISQAASTGVLKLAEPSIKAGAAAISADWLLHGKEEAPPPPCSFLALRTNVVDGAVAGAGAAFAEVMVPAVASTTFTGGTAALPSLTAVGGATLGGGVIGGMLGTVATAIECSNHLANNN